MLATGDAIFRRDEAQLRVLIWDDSGVVMRYEHVAVC
ncbi:hypothetical protein B0H03_106132 [Rathayibacter iranicus NCPPB 2253 = VKM Ac-1602]|uniref:Transposase n=1 Tax=Rathayibacter iranicus NCPPB 2253 = VKM Ac-1602 TaxID=1328868 RepID=A0ABX5LCB6_9MICO|nr:hypothetical protein B0H03_106132 [Rathayibacter iranicus NCPPB 2253 = VKM Ac-1602]